MKTTTVKDELLKVAEQERRLSKVAAMIRASYDLPDNDGVILPNLPAEELERKRDVHARREQQLLDLACEL